MNVTFSPPNTLVIKINVDNDAFVDNTQDEVARILIDLIWHKFSRLADSETVKLYDINGNPCGIAYVQLTQETEQLQRKVNR